MKKILSGAIAFFTSFGAFAFSGNGAGTEKSPYLITSADELFEVRSDMSAYYKLVNDIDLSEWLEENSSDYGWSPIGTASSPFTGSFDGNGKKILNLIINRPQTDNVGLFGYTTGATFSNIVIVNPQIVGQNNVGTILGQRNANTSYNESGFPALTITGCYVIGGTVEGEQNVGGILGYNYCSGNSGSMNISTCHNSADVNGKEKCGGILGLMIAYSSPGLYVCDCYSIGNVTGTSSVGGILGHAEVYYSWVSKYDCGRPDLVCERNYIRGNISGVTNTCGVAGYAEAHNWTTGSWGSPTYTGIYTMSSNVCIADTIRGSYRIASNVSSEDNYASSNTIVLMENGVTADIEDNAKNGISMGTRLLQKAATYQSLGWDFSSTWTDYSSYNEYPAHVNVSIAPIVESFEAKSKGVIKGNATFINGLVYCIIDRILYTSTIEDGKWSITLGNISKGQKAIVAVCENNKLPSSIVSSFAEKIYVEPINIMGDSNSDGVVDVADVVGTINYIIGKPSPSFNETNTDLNGDGQVLVDDVVGIVNIIMNAQ